VRVAQAWREAALWFPVGDVDLAGFTAHEHACPHAGRGWSVAGAEPVDDSDSDFAGDCVLHDVAEGYVEFDHRRVRVELIDGAPDAEPRDITVRRFPDWGDVGDLVDVLDVEPVGEGRYAGRPYTGAVARIVEGSQLLAQSLVAACREVPSRRVTSAHFVFTRGADPNQPIDFTVEAHTNGRTMSTLGVRVTQAERLCAVGTVLLGTIAPDVIRHAAAAPDVAGPYDSEPYDMRVTGRDLRIVDGAYTGDPQAPVGPPVLDAWLRYRGVPDRPELRAAIVAHFTGHLSIAAALRPHAGIGEHDAHRTLSTAINAIHVSFHADPQPHEWLLYRHLSTFAGDGMTHAECRVFGPAEALVASFSVEAMVRRFDGKPASTDDRSVL